MRKRIRRKIICLLLLLSFVSSVFAYQFYQKPPLGTQINWSNPLTKSLVGCWLLNEGSGNKANDLLRASNLINFNANTYFLGDRVSTQVDGAGFWGFLSPNLEKAPPVTIVWYGMFTGTPEANANIFGISWNNLGSSPYCCYSINVDASGGDFRIALNNGGTFVGMASGYTIESNIPYVVVAVFRSNSNRELFVNGNSVLLSTTSYSSPTFGNSIVLFGAEPGATTRNTACVNYFGMFFHRALTVSEIRSITDNPYQFIQQPKSWWKAAVEAAGTFIKNIFGDGVSRGIGTGAR